MQFSKNDPETKKNVTEEDATTLPKQRLQHATQQTAKADKYIHYGINRVTDLRRPWMATSTAACKLFRNKKTSAA